MSSSSSSSSGAPRFLGVSLLCLAACFSIPALQAQDLTDLQNPPRVDGKPANLRATSQLIDAGRNVARKGALAVANDLRSQGFQMSGDDFVVVEITAGDPSFDLAGLVAASGGTMAESWGDRTEVRLPVAALETVAASLPASHWMEPMGFGLKVLDFEGEGPVVMNSHDYRVDGYDGTGITIAVIDIGYAGLTQSVNSGDAPATYESFNYTGTGLMLPVSDNHGRFVVETIFDQAPGADYILMKAVGETDIATAMAQAVTSGADIISMSVGYFPLWEDDSNVVSQAANAAAQAGVLVFNSAGNEAREHWQGNFSDNDGDDYHSWNGGVDEALGLTLLPGDTLNLRLTWDRSGGNHDYDLYVYSQDGSQVWASSTSIGEAYEQINLTNGNPFAINPQMVVERRSGGGTALEVYSSGATWQQYAVAAGSTLAPSNATHPNVISVGAVPHPSYGSNKYTSGIIANYSSQGPTNDGMLVPDVCAPTSTAVSFNPSFTGTSCACPNAAGVAACLWSVNPAGTASQVRGLLYEWAARKDWGSPGADNIYGRGGICFPPYADCNGDTNPDAFDIASGGSDDDNQNGIPDECEAPGYGYGWKAPDQADEDGFLMIATIDSTPDPAGPLSPVTGFRMVIGYDPIGMLLPAVQRAQELVELIGGEPMVFDVEDTGSAIIVECVFGVVAATGAPLALPLDLATEAVVIECQPIPSTAPGSSTTQLTFQDIAITGAAPLSNELFLPGGGTQAPSTLTPAVILPTEVKEHTYSLSSAVVFYDASSLEQPVTLYWSLDGNVEDPSPTAGYRMALRHDPGYLQATEAVLLDEWALADVDVFLVEFGATGVSAHVAYSSDGTLLGTPALFPLPVAAIGYESQGLLSGDPVGHSTAVEFDGNNGIAGAQNLVYGPSGDEVPLRSSGAVHFVPVLSAARFLRGDVNQDSAADIGDSIQLLSYLFQGGTEPGCLDSADVNDDGGVTIADPIFLLTYLFQSGATPPAPGTAACGEDPTEDALDCASDGC